MYFIEVLNLFGGCEVTDSLYFVHRWWVLTFASLMWSKTSPKMWHYIKQRSLIQHLHHSEHIQSFIPVHLWLPLILFPYCNLWLTEKDGLIYLGKVEKIKVFKPYGASFNTWPIKDNTVKSHVISCIYTMCLHSISSELLCRGSLNVSFPLCQVRWSSSSTRNENRNLIGWQESWSIIRLETHISHVTAAKKKILL